MHFVPGFFHSGVLRAGSFHSLLRCQAELYGADLLQVAHSLASRGTVWIVFSLCLFWRERLWAIPHRSLSGHVLSCHLGRSLQAQLLGRITKGHTLRNHKTAFPIGCSILKYNDPLSPYACQHLASSVSWIVGVMVVVCWNRIIV